MMNSEAPPATSVTIILADDHKVVRSGLRLLLESHARNEIIDEAGDIAETVSKVLSRHPQVLVLDLNMGGESSLETIPQLRAKAPATQIVVLTMQENPAFARAALQAGAVGYVLKDAADDELLDAVALAAQGRIYLNSGLGAKLLAQPADGAERPDNLSSRELEVLRLIALGNTNTEIATSLVLSVRTVESHRAHIQQKISLTSRSELVAYTREHGLLN